jgi:hypothetical protein
MNVEHRPEEAESSYGASLCKSEIWLIYEIPAIIELVLIYQWYLTVAAGDCLWPVISMAIKSMGAFLLFLDCCCYLFDC